VLATGYTDGAIVLWSLPDATVRAVLRGHSNWVRGLAFSRDGARLVSASNDGQLRIWDAQSHVLLHTLDGHTDWVMGVALSPDGATIASCSQDQTVRLWRTDDPAAPPVILRDHTAGVHKVAFSPSGRLLASNDGSVRIWRVSDGKLLYTVRPPGLYEGMNLTNAVGLSSAQRSVVARLGAVVGDSP
jgi:WD40 repeat protein